MTRLDSLLSWFQPPEGVERASLPERVKRNAWLLVSSFATLALVGVVGSVALLEHLPATLALAITFTAWAIIDMKVFTWGVERFDIVLPWQFRVDDDRGGG